MALDLIALEAPLEPVRFPNGNEYPVVPFGPAEYELYATLPSLPPVEAFARTVALLQHCVPGATPADLDTLSPRMMAAILGHAQFKIEQVLAVMGNGLGAEGTTSPPSAPSVSPSTPSPGSPGRSGRRSSRSGAGRSTKPSSRSTRSRTSSASSD